MTPPDNWPPVSEAPLHTPLRWINRFARLSERVQRTYGVRMGVEMPAQPLPDLRWVAHSDQLAQALGWGINWWQAPAETAAGVQAALNVFGGNALWAGMRPLASVYSGHQFGQWAGQLGDGRALLLGELETPQGPLEVQLKGGGFTPYSRRGDGRAVLRSSVREFLCSEAMHALGIPTTRALCLSVSSQPVQREAVERAAVVTRVAPSFIRFGHFEHFAHSGSRGHHLALAALVDHVVDDHLAHLPDLVGLPPALVGADGGGEACLGDGSRAVALLAHVAQTTADLMAQWQAVGFCHGVMNTDNMSILGLTIDYGPFGFMDQFDPNHVCNHSDIAGRYRWRHQPDVGLWNVSALAHALAPLVPGANADNSPEQWRLVQALEAYEARYEQQMLMRWRAKLGLAQARDDDATLAQDFLSLMAKGRLDFTITFRRLGQWRSDLPVDAPENSPVRDLFLDRAAFDAWAANYSLRLQAEGSVDAERRERMNLVNPWVVLRNHLAQVAIDRAERGDFSEVQRLYSVLSRPFDEQPAHAADADFPPEWAGTIEVSCSS
jgi:serine/tyrosine/threonine adenylyltransferase